MFKMALPQWENKERPGVSLPAARIHLSIEEIPIAEKGAGALLKSRRDTAGRRIKNVEHQGESNVVANPGSKLPKIVPSVHCDRKELEGPLDGPVRKTTQEITDGGRGDGRKEHTNAVCANRASRDGHAEAEGAKAGQATNVRLQNEDEGKVVDKRRAEREKQEGLPLVAGKMLSHALGLTQRGRVQIGRR
jgi:hypothetical protein